MPVLSQRHWEVVSMDTSVLYYPMTDTALSRTISSSSSQPILEHSLHRPPALLHKLKLQEMSGKNQGKPSNSVKPQRKRSLLFSLKPLIRFISDPFSIEPLANIPTISVISFFICLTHMKRLLLTALIALSSPALAQQSKLPPCPENQNKIYNKCFGTKYLTSIDGTATGE